MSKPADDMTSRAIDAAISNIESATKDLGEWHDSITLAQFRRLKLARYVLADFLVLALKVDAGRQPEPEAGT